MSPDDKKGILEAFTTAFEISLAAESAEEIKGEFLTQTELFERYTRRCLSYFKDSVAVRQLLIALANKMANRMVKSLPLSEVERIGLPFSEINPNQVSIFNDALDSALLETREGRCNFRHELFQQFFEALAFLRAFSKPNTLAANLKLARYAHIQEFVIGLLEDEESLKECLLSISDEGLLRNSLLGYLGESAKNIVIRDAHGLIKKAIQDLENIGFQLVPVENAIPYFAFEGAAMWTQYEMALMKAIGQVIGTGLCLEEVFYLVRKTDKVSHNQLLEKEGFLKPSRLSVIFQQLYVWEFGGGVQTVLPATVIVVAFHNEFFRPLQTEVNKLEKYCQRIEELTPGELYLLCLLLKPDNEKMVIDRVVDILLSLGRVCWEKRIYNLQLEMLDVIGSYRRRLTGESLEKVKSMLSNFETNNIMLNTALIDISLPFGLIETPIGIKQAEEEIKEVLQSPECQEILEKASRIVTNQLEDIYQGVYYEAIKNLAQEDKIRLYTLAALGSPSYSFFTDWLLLELLKLNDPKTLPAFQRWATELDPASINPFEAATCYACACVGCSLFMDSPPRLKNLGSDNHLAWQTYGEILFWIHKSGLSDEEIQRHCLPLWKKLQKIPFEAVDPLMQLHNSSLKILDERWNFGKALCGRFREQIRDLMEFGLKKRSHLSTLFGRLPQPFREKNLTQFLISQLGEIGNLKTIKFLDPSLSHQSMEN